METKETRFQFGENWKKYLTTVNEERIAGARKSLQTMFAVEDFTGFRFLDAGCGSGLFSLAARQLGATVVSFDYDINSVGCTQTLKDRYFPNDNNWQIARGDVLDAHYIQSLGQFDLVYSWGVLHHTGNLELALQHIAKCVAEDGQLFIAIYNDQLWVSSYWTIVKRLYNQNTALRWLMIAVHIPYPLLARYLVRLLTGRFTLERGMTYWWDYIDWLGGYPFEVAKPEKIIDTFLVKGFTLQKLVTCGGRSGCNEFVLHKVAESSVMQLAQNQ